VNLANVGARTLCLMLLPCVTCQLTEKSSLLRLRLKVVEAGFVPDGFFFCRLALHATCCCPPVAHTDCSMQGTVQRKAAAAPSMRSQVCLSHHHELGLPMISSPLHCTMAAAGDAEICAVNLDR
jgi:hypothetical protein